MAFASVRCRRFFEAFFVLFLLAGMAGADQATRGAGPTVEIPANPQAAYTFIGLDQLGLALGLSEESGVRLGGFLWPEVNWIASGGVRPKSAFGRFALGLHASLDTQKALGIPGGTLGIEFLEFAGATINNAAGCVQQYNGYDGVVPRTRQELSQVWWQQRLFHDKLILHIGKLNPASSFGAVLTPVTISDPKLQDTYISILPWTPVGINPTMFGRLPIYLNTAYGVAVHFAPTKNLYASYGLFDGNQAIGKQTGLMLEPRINSYKFHIGELGYLWGLDAKTKPGRFGVGAWVQTGELLTPYFTKIENGTPYFTRENGATGYYLFANQRLWYQHPDRDNSGLIGYLQFGHAGDHAVAANTYFGAGLTGVGLVPVLPHDIISIGMAWSRLNDAPLAGAFFFPGVPSDSSRLRASELMLQVAFQTTFIFPMPRGSGSWTLTPLAAYTFIPTPGQRPDLPAAHVMTARLVILF